MESLSIIGSGTLLLFIRIYQYIINPLLGGPYCRFKPTCSQYAIQVIKKFGVLRGSWLTTKRILNCHPVKKTSK